jgi:multidrug efflux pump subunit AcrA (membrane-fusion protein)
MNPVSRRCLPARYRAGFSVRGLLIAVPIVVAIPAIAWSFLPGRSWSSDESGPMMVKVERGEFIHEITEHGDVESASNVEIRCEVQAQGSAGTTILWIIPEGTYVKPGDKLVELDKSALENSQVQQQIVCANSEAAAIQARNDLASAKIALEEYNNGTFVQDRTTIVNETLVAKETWNRAKDYADYSERLAAKGFITKVQLQADQFAVEKAAKDLELANRKLMVLEKYTSAKMLNQLKATIATCEAKLKAAENSHALDMKKLELIETQIKNCIITAPEAGQVVYASQRDARGGNEIIIEEGAQVRERQVIFRLPDPKRMQVTAKINEAKVAQVVEGMPATIAVDAFQDMRLTGVVKKVNEYPAPTSWFNSHVKEYDTIVSIQSPPPGLRPGLTAEVKIRVAQLTNVLQLPVQAIFEHGGQHYCIVRDGEVLSAQPVEIGPTNDKFLVIRDGLEEGQSVVLNAASHRERVELPEVPPQAQDRPAGAAGSKPAEASAPGEKSEQPKPKDAARRDSGQREGQMFQQLDKNGDGKLQQDELPEGMRPMFSSADTNHDGGLDRGEASAALKRLGQGGDGRSGGPSGGSP